MSKVKDYLSDGYFCTKCGKYLGKPKDKCQRTCSDRTLDGKKEELISDRAREQSMDEEYNDDEKRD